MAHGYGWTGTREGWNCYERDRPGVIRASVHAHVYGRSWGRWAFRGTIRYAKRFSDVWITTRAKLAEHVLRQYASQRDKGAIATDTRG